MIIETKRKRRVYKDPIIIYEYKTNRQMGIIEKTPIYVFERAKSFLIAKQKGKFYFNYRCKSILKKEETGIVIRENFNKVSYLYLLADDDNKASELFTEHFEQLKKIEKDILDEAKLFYYKELAILECLALMEIKEEEK
jgi:hypothetical protein